MEKTGASARQWRGGSVKRRWFVSKGYLVEYFEAAPRVGQAPRPKGAFDLRYVERLQPSDDATRLDDDTKKFFDARRMLVVVFARARVQQRRRFVVRVFL